MHLYKFKTISVVHMAIHGFLKINKETLKFVKSPVSSLIDYKETTCYIQYPYPFLIGCTDTMAKNR